jgi:tRNA A-37 threonylcarbamoyl transferase component Bud32
MAADLSRCPSLGELESLLGERLNGPERDTVETHVEDCTPCQEQLARLSARTFRPVASPTGGRDEPDPEPDEGFLRRLREMPPPRLVVSGGGVPPRGTDESVPSAAGPAPAAAWFEHGRLGQYEILGRLAKGGMGAVFKARHAELGKVVALKVLPADQMDEVLVARFKNEIRAIGRLDHPNVVAAHDAGEFRGIHFLVMDFIDGVDLARVLEGQGRLSIPDACEAVRQAALGLQHAFERGLVHRDIKPSNLMLARGGRVQVLDLGLARSFGDATADTLTAKGTLLGTTDYLAPEQWEHAHAADTRADIYSLGCTLYHLITGRPPFAGEQHQSVLQKMLAHLKTPPPPIGQLQPEVPAGLAAVLDRMLAKDPANRFESPAAVAEALRPFTPGSDLGHLLGGPDTPVGHWAAAALAEAPTIDPATPEPAMWETTSERGGRGGGPDTPVGRRFPVAPSRYALPVALAGLCLLLAAASLFWPGFGGSSGPAAKPLEVKEMHVTHFRDKGATRLGDLWTSPGAIRLNDDVRVTAELSAPAYCYLIAFNPDGTDQLCHPENPDGHGALAVRPDARAEVRYPQDDRVFVLDATGLQAFVLAASAKPLPPYAEWRSRAGEIPWKAVQEGGAWRWYFDGREFSRFPQERGKIESKEAAPKPLRELFDFFKNRTEFEAVQLVAFPVVGEP